MTESCRFDASRLESPILSAALDPALNRTASFQYRCELCGLWHWTVPELETDGTAVTAELAVEEIKDALDRWYMATLGVTWREAIGAGETRHPWMPTPL